MANKRSLAPYFKRDMQNKPYRQAAIQRCVSSTMNSYNSSKLPRRDLKKVYRKAVSDCTKEVMRSGEMLPPRQLPR